MQMDNHWNLPEAIGLLSFSENHCFWFVQGLPTHNFFLQNMNQLDHKKQILSCLHHVLSKSCNDNFLCLFSCPLYNQVHEIFLICLSVRHLCVIFGLMWFCRTTLLQKDNFQDLSNDISSIFLYSQMSALSYSLID